MTISIDLPITEIFEGYIPDKKDLLTTLKFIFKSLKLGGTFNGDVLTLEFDNSELFQDDVSDIKHNPKGYEKLTPKTMNPDGNFKPIFGVDGKSSMMDIIVKYFDRFFNYTTRRKGDLNIYVSHNDLRKYSSDPEDFD